MTADAELIDGYASLGATSAARHNRHGAGRRFTERFGSLNAWHHVAVAERLAAPVVLRSYVSWAIVAAGCAVDADYVVGAPTKWALHVGEREPLARAELETVAAELGFKPLEIRHMWAALAKLSVIAGIPAGVIAHDAFCTTRDEYLAAVNRRCGAIPKIFGTPIFGLNAVMFHLGRAPAPKRRTRPGTRERDWEALAKCRPQLVATMRRYLDQLSLSLRPGSFETIDTTLRLFAEFLTANHPEVISTAAVARTHVEAFKPWLAVRPGRRGRTELTPTTIGMRLGHLRSFFARIIEWGYDDAPGRVPVLLGDFPIRNRALPRFLDDPSAGKLLAAARSLPDLFDRVVVEMLARTAMRRGELLGLTIDAVVQIGSAFWLRTPVGKLHNDRYIPLHPQLKALLDEWLNQRSPALRSDLMFCDRGRPIPAQRVDRAVQRAAAAAGLGHVHPHQLRHTLATQAINRGMSLEAIAALLATSPSR